MVNKTMLLSATVIIMLALSAGGVWADVGADMTISGSDVKWSQPPDMKYGVNIQSTEEEPIVADDWKCRDPRPLTDIHFWGSYIGWETKNEKPQLRTPRVEGFVIRIYEDVPAVAGTRHYSHPGELIYKEKVEKFEETSVAAILLPDDTYEHKFHYSIDLNEPFKQTEGTIYWISIAAILPGEYKYPWGWETSTHHWNDDACRYWHHNNYWEEILPSQLPPWYQEQHDTVDMAFELTVRSQSPPIKWQQRPDMVQGTNVISLVDDYGDDDLKSLTVADDWLCLDGSPVTDLHFWGSYPGWHPDKVPRDPETPPGVKEFRIRIYSDVPTVIGRDGFSHPGKLLYESWTGDFTETYVGSILLPWEQYEHKYRYDLYLPKSFPQEQDTIYWLSIAAITLNHTYPWGWESSMDRWNDFAVQGWYRDPDNSEWDLIHHPQTERHIDMAFELTTGDGPIKWLQFPDMADGVNILSLPEDPVVADDWLCTDGKPITEVRFWGSYLSREEDKHWEQENPGPPEKPLSQPPGVSEFKFSFHKDIPAGTDREMPWSHPGELLHEVWMDPDEVKEHYWDSIPHTGVDGDIWWEHKFYYVARLKEPFKQEKGTIYWLDIGAKPRDDMWYWGWETSIRHWNDNAVRGWKGGNWWECLGSTTIDFEDLPPGTKYNVGDAFTTPSIPVTVKQFQGGDEGWTSDGYTQIENSGQAGGSGNEMVVNNVNLDFDFDFGTPKKSLSLLFGEYGGNSNIRINEDLRNFNSFADINGLMIGGVHVTVIDHGDNTGILTLTGTTEQFAIGGQEFWIDNVKLVKRVDMAFALTTETEAAEHDLGDAPDTTNSHIAPMTAYPGVPANFPTIYQAGSPPHGPIHRQPKALAFLGRSVTLEDEADTGLDEDGVNNLNPPNNAANRDKADDGVNMPLTLVHCKPNTFDYVVTVVDPLQRSVNVNVWFDWNRDGDWNDVMSCSAMDPVAPVPEWAVQNQQLQLNGTGTFTFTTPRFMAWLSPTDKVAPAATWMRITLSEQKWDPISDVNGAGGSGPADGYQYGETEDYYVQYSQPQPNTKWVQLPDLTQNGIDIKVDELHNIADDFECTSQSLLTDVHFWGSWKDDRKGRIENIRLSIHSDDPVGIGGTDSDNKFSKPDKQLWSHDFGPEEFRELLYHTVPDHGEWWWDPASREGAIPGGDTQVWRYDIKIDSDEAFLQRGTPEKPVIYWLYIVVETDEECEFGWKTREWSDHFMDDAVWDYGSELPRLWKELRYPKGHPYHGLERDSIDMAFMLTFEGVDWGDAPEGTVAPGYPTLLGSNGARHTIVPGFYLGRTIRISQESSPGAGDFDANVLGYVSPYATSLSTAGYYQYGTPYGASFNGPAPPLTSNRSHLFLADTADGLSLFTVHDKPVDGCGGFASTHWTLAGDTAGVLVEDDPGETVTVSGGGTIFDSYHRWDSCCTDGMALGSLDGAWTMIGAMTGNFTGMSEWHVHSSDNSSIVLSFELNRRVRLDYHDAIDPEPDGQPDANALGDDNDGNDDENGVVFNTPLVAGKPATVTVTASTQGLLQGWIDFNADRDWADSSEQIFVDQVLVSGPNTLNFIVPATTVSGATFARFRFSMVRGLSFEGPAPDGEVEDYRVTIGCKPGIDVEKTVFDPETGEWMDAITADVGDTVRFRFTIHNDGTCCDLTDIVVADKLSESLKYRDNATVNGMPGKPTFIGIISVVWEFPDLVLEPCQTITIEFDAEVVECGIDENIVTVKAVCVDADVIVRDEDTATVMAGKPELEWTWNSTTVEPDYVQVMMSPVVADLNGDDIPDIIFSTFNRSWLAGGILRAISGDGSGEIFSVTDPDYRVQAGAEPAVADIDGDGKPEIMVSKNTSEIICFEHDGTFKWLSSSTVGRCAIAVANLDQDGTPEIIAGRTVFNNDGTVRWTGTSGSSYASVVADLDLDGKPEVVTGSTAYRYNGTIYWTSAYGGMPAIGNFDSDPYPEIVVVGGNNVSLKEHDGTLKWGPVAMPDGGGNGPPVVADIDGDGELEIGVGGRLHYVAFETNGSIKWMADIVDISSRAAGSSAFDFDSDGSCEIVYSDHQYHHIFKGSDETVLFKTPGPSGTLIEQPIIADVDNDGHVEIVFAVNNYGIPGNTGIEVYGNDECWRAARPIWNQHTYHITNINDDATVPVVETNNWDVFNNYRVQSPHSCGEVNVTTVDITPPSQDVYSGPFTVNVTVNPVESITGVQFDLSFNTSLVSADSVIEGDLLSQNGASAFFSPGTIDNAAGTITSVAGAITTPGATVSSPGVFATIRMTAKSVEGTSSLDLSNVIVGDINGDPVSIMVNDGTVTITTCIGDVNGDGTVDVLDMIRVGQHWEETGTSGWIPEDVNRDGVINVLDMIIIGQHWGPCQEA
ncbi:MAG: hypothetical protein EF813_08410 [Methanosarcinales archaeon]|nr:MAG: hypothetical protein EF813_08410 [Methanosarcinales archaeon]